ncbi:MAG: DUF1501 domain-containing protein [Planctomycetales bacterium]|nr:DUF1501 domain-containing protein [Planctomycetales bacterium]
MESLPMINRRTILAASTVGYAGLRWARPSCGAPAGANSGGGRAKSTILFFLCGGASHIDTWDMKPDAPAEYRGAFDPIETSAAGVQLCEHLPMTAKNAHHLAIVRSITDGGRATGDHHAGYYYNLTGRVPDITFRTQGNDRRPQPTDWPFMGTIVGAHRPPHPSLPQTITLPHKPSRAPYTRPGQFAAKLGVQHDPFYLNGDFDAPTKFLAPTLSLEQGLSLERMGERRSLMQSLNDARRRFEHDDNVASLDIQNRKAFQLLASSTTADAFDLGRESAATLERYGETINGMSLLMARRLVEAGVPFVTVFWKENSTLAGKCRSAGGWDTHGNNFNCLREHLLPEFDRAYSALLEDLQQRGMLDETLVLVSSEMGRKPKIGDPRSGGANGAGRDHWTACMSVLMAGGGVRGGQCYGKTDPVGAYPVENVITPAEVTQTVYHAMGVDKLVIEENGRPVNLLDNGRPLTELF